MIVDLIVKDATIVTSNRNFKGNIAINDGRIVGIGSTPSFTSADRIINASGKTVIPGIVDSHVHFRDPGLTDMEDYTTGTRAAAAGGVTFVADMPNTNPVPNTAERYSQHVQNASRKACVDFTSWASPTVKEEISKIGKLGTCGFKFFMRGGGKDAYPYTPETSIGDDYTMFSTLEEISKTSLTCAVHPWSQDLWQGIVADHKSKGVTDADSSYNAYFSHNYLLWRLAVMRLLLLGTEAGARLRICHVNHPAAADLVLRARKAGAKFTAELNPWITFTFVKGASPYADAAQPQELMWAALNDPLKVDVISSDHSPHKPHEVINRSDNAFEPLRGCSYIEHCLPLMLDAVNKNKLGLSRLVKVFSENPAKDLSVYPRKGAILLGSDADLVILDMKKTFKIKSETMKSKSNWTRYEGLELQGAPTMAIQRGRVIMEEGTVTAKEGQGMFVPSKG